MKDERTETLVARLLERATQWKAVAESQAARVREIEGTLEAKRELVHQSSKAIASLSNRVGSLERVRDEHVAIIEQGRSTINMLRVEREELARRVAELEAALTKCPGCGVALQTLDDSKRIIHSQMCDWEKGH